MKGCRFTRGYSRHYRCPRTGWLPSQDGLLCVEHWLERWRWDFHCLGDRVHVSIDLSNVNRPYVQVEDEHDVPRWWAVSFGNGNSDPVISVQVDRRRLMRDPTPLDGPPWERTFAKWVMTDRRQMDELGESWTELLRTLGWLLNHAVREAWAVPVRAAEMQVSGDHSDAFVRGQVVVLAEQRALVLRQPGLPVLVLWPTVARLERRWAARPRPVRTLRRRLLPADERGRVETSVGA